MAETQTPEWLKAHQEANASSAGQRGWQPGQSGNPRGRPVGSRNKKNVIADEFAKDGSAVARVVMDAALAGDMQAANLVLQRLSPPLRARAEKVTFELTPDAPLTTQAQQIMTAVAEGSIDPETGQLLINCITAFAGLKQVDELEARLIALEEKQA
ncbi:DUF5681 domain-containing protein [Stenotrophomonas maltophilia]|uniref:DUF5681 domain-containing protein n=1 Tax=Stenotrophomonas maltophilia TaxID=40324 RepID=UPI000C25989B|nr:DUF5681 domain-containing protein [Stenotrophomonas maltophilia]MBG4376963.1 hypothetical protein [Pseudomonas aeruginosa]MCT5067068.1 DUF5681 domain-containing protein [Pseudomonas aeruginosa]PJL05900.1 hypothetical protein B9Y57_02525 [Stenotrophomonas maltophilia]PJL32964.1 hypothetical protein B9Y65_02525 [Stenotrophomonas maltophilia]HBP5135553.1 hypothetical protein [Pseudomonas aeruginosa]